MLYRIQRSKILFSLFWIIAVLNLVFSSVNEDKIQIIPEESSRITELRYEVAELIDSLSDRMIVINNSMYHNPEPGFLEFESSALLVNELKKHGFIVEMGVPNLNSEFDKLKIVGGFPSDYDGPPGIPTAFKAKYKGKSEHPVIGIAVEYDALRGDPPFHGCQHNMQGPVGIGAGIALAKIMDKYDIPGSIWIIGCPAEEVGPPTKAAMAKTGYFNEIDIMMRSHGTAHETLRYPGGFSPRHIRQMKYTFHGQSAHAQRAWEGKSSLDAVLLLFHAVDMIREHSEPQFRFHGVITEGGSAPNIVPDRATALIWIRHIMDETPTGNLTPREARDKIEKKMSALDKMAEAAAMATGTSVDLAHYGEYDAGIAIGILNDLAFQYAVDYGGINIGERAVPRHWEETGFGTLVVPGVHISIGTEGIPETRGHSQENADLTISDAGHKSLILTAKVMAAVGLRLFLDPQYIKKAISEHSDWVKKYNQ